MPGSSLILNAPRVLVLLAIVALLALGVAEVVLRVVSGFGPSGGFLTDRFGENFYFARKPSEQPPSPSPQKFDHLLGWNARELQPSAELNAQGWRSPLDYTEPKRRPRVLVVGASYTFGIGLSDQDTITARLQQKLGKAFEVLTIAADQFGLDQMVLAATELGSKYGADVVIVGFAVDNLRRSCARFGAGERLKPYFLLRGDGLELRGTPVIPAEENVAWHQQWIPSLADQAIYLVAQSRVLDRILSTRLAAEHRRCLEEINTRLLIRAEKRLAHSALFSVHLEGELPTGFTANLLHHGLGLVSYPEREAKLSPEQRKNLGTTDGYHPDTHRAEQIASLYAELIQQDPRTQKKSSSF